ncbi:MAG: DUF2807 domain-containing protein [Pseudomonadota bacterium]
MRKYLKTVVAAGAVAASINGVASAQDQSFQNIETVKVEDFIGTVSIKVSKNRNAVSSSAQSGADASYPYYIEQDNGVLTIRSDADPDDTRWWKEVNWRRDKDRAFAVFLEDYPSVELTVPAGVDLEFDSAVMLLEAGDTNGAVEMRDGHVDGVIGDIRFGEIKIDGSGDLTVGDVSEALAISIHGSGDFLAGNASLLDADIHGSGDIKVSNIRGDASVRVHGSGDVKMDNVDGDVDVSVHGSGDISAGRVSGGAALSTHGSGDIRLASVSGATNVSINGSGDTSILDGRAEDLRVRVSGSGDFEMDGVATNPNVSANGSGDIRIRRHEGSVRSSGRGDIIISGVNYTDRD